MTYEITKAEWQRRGGLRNSDLFRRQDHDGKWRYFAGAST